MKVSADEAKIITAYRDGARIDVSFGTCLSRKSAVRKLNKNGFHEYDERFFEDGDVMLYTEICPINRIEARAFYEVNSDEDKQID